MQFLTSGPMPFPVICLIYIIGLAIIFVELFVPGGILGFIGAIVLVTSIMTAFYYHPPIYGISLLLLSSLIIPTMVVWSIRRVSLTSSQNVEDGYISTPEGEEELLGKEGVTVTMLRPSGMARIDNRQVDVVAENIIVEKGTPVKVVKVEGNQIVVRPI